MKQIALSLFLILFTIVSFAQKEPLTHEVYDSWKDIKDFRLSDDGRFPHIY
jgi:hypothetical protein